MSDDYFGGSFSEAYDVLRGLLEIVTTLVQMLLTWLLILKLSDAQDAGAEGVETTSSINTASLGVSMSAGDGWTTSTSGTINLGGGSVAGGAMSISNGY